MDLRLKKCSALLAVAALTSFLTVNMANATDVNVSNWTALKNAIANNTVSTITLTENIANADSDLPDIASIVLTIDGNNKTIWGTGTKAFEGTYVDLGRTLTIQNISNNTADITKATSGVGGFNNFILNKGTTNISNSYFENNSAVDVDYLRRGGVIHNAAVNGSAFSKVSILNSIFKSNSANLSGGAIYFKSAPTENASELTVGSSSDNTKFEGNHTSYDGGAIYIDSSANAKTVTGSITADFTNNYVSNSDDDAWGGAISINALVGTSISDRYVISGDFTGNYATTTSTNAANGAFGGALSIDNEYGTSSFVAVNGSTFINNYTKATSEKSYGGAIYSSSDLEITGSTFTNNGKKEGNAVTTAGGAIANAGDLKITGSTFTNNAATAYGGAIVNQGTLQITDSSFTGNTAGMSGGAIVNMEDATLTINAQGGNVTFSNNTVNGAPNDIDNSGTLDLNATGVNTITLNGGITGSKGTTNVKTGKTIVSSIEQKALNISNGATLNVNASNISTSTNSITNAGTIELGTGTLENSITGNGTGKTQINGVVTSNAAIQNAIEILGTNKLTIDADNVDGNVTNLAGTIKLGNGGLAYNIIGNGTTQIAGDVINNAIMSQNKLVIDADRTLSFANNGKFIIKNNLENSGTFAAKFANIYIGDRDTANIGSITNNAGATMNLDSSGATVDDVAVYAYIYNEGIINMDGSGAFNLYSDIDDGDGNGTLILNESAKVVSYGSIEQNQVTISENAELTNDGSYQGGGTITANSITNSGILTNTGIITAALTNSGTLTSAADKIVGNITNNGTYNVQGGTLNDAITGTGIINLAEDVKLTLGSGASFADGQTFNAGNNSTISLLGAATTATINGLTIADGEHMNLEIDWKDKFNSGGSGITGSGKVLLSTIDLTSTSGLANGSYEFTNLGNKVTLSPIVKLVDNSVGSNAYNSVKYESGSLYGSRTNLASTIQNTATGSSSATVYSMSGNESADNQTVKNNMFIQGNGNTITGSGIVVDAPVTTTIDGLVLKDVNLDGISIDTSASGAIHVKDSSALGVFAVEDDITIKGTTGATNTAIYLENGADAELGAAAGRKITISDNIISEHASNNIYLSGLGEIVLSGLLDPATINVGTTTTREAAYAAAGETLTTYDEGIDWNLNAGGSLKYNNDNILYNPAHHTTTALQNTMNLNGGSLDLRNGVASTILLNSDGLSGRVAAGTGLNLSANSNIYLDVDLANKKMDNFGTSNINRTGTATLNVAGLKLISDATETNTDITFIEKSNITGTKDGAVTYSGGTVLTALSPVYRYNVLLNESATEYGFNFTRSGGYDGFNPAVMASPVAAQVGSYLTQLNNYEQAFANMDMTMLMTKQQRQAMKFANKYASTQGPAQGGVITYDPNQIPEQQRGAWFRPFATFENVGLKNGPTVGNVAYGSLFGGDSDLIELSHGWDMVWSAYAGYNGSHQTYDGVGIYQNGGTLGASAAFYKGNFFTGLTANVGANVGEASTMFGSDTFTMLTTGIASKTGYNFELADGKFIIQPNWLMSYSFVNTFDYTNAAGVKIDSAPLNAIQIAPGIKFIGNLKNGWQPYASVQMVWNIMDQTKFSANDVSLPELSVKPYIQYGVGLQKRWGDRFTAFGQAMIRNGGRNGIALQFGARWTLGKDSSKTKASKAMKQIKEPKLNLSSKK